MNIEKTQESIRRTLQWCASKLAVMSGALDPEIPKKMLEGWPVQETVELVNVVNKVATAIDSLWETSGCARFTVNIPAKTPRAFIEEGTIKAHIKPEVYEQMVRDGVASYDVSGKKGKDDDTMNLTPVYAVLVFDPMEFKLPNSRRRERMVEEERDEHGLYSKIPYTEAAARARAEFWEGQGQWVRVYHYGYKERGFRVGERACKTLYQSPAMTDLLESEKI